MPYRLKSHVPYLVARVAALVSEAIVPVLREYDITLPMWRVMAALAEIHEQTVGALLIATSLEQSTLSRTLTALQQRGLISKKIGRDDARTMTVALRARGRAFTERLAPHWAEAHRSLVAGVTPADLETFTHVLEQLYDNVSATTDTPTARMRLRAGALQRKR